MTITLRIAKGSPLTIAELDGNFEDLDGRVVTLEDTAIAARSIEEIVQVGNSLIVEYTDSTQDGPFTFEVHITFRGDWEPATAYALNDLIHAEGVIYIVSFAHISEATFDPGANNGTSGDNYYTPFLTMPELQLPIGGGEGFVLAKASEDDYDTEWRNSAVPAGGTTAQVLRKVSAEDYDTEWQDLALDDLSDVEVDTSPSTGDVLTFSGGTWVNAAPLQTLETTSSTTVDPDLDDAGKYFRCTAATNVTVTIPLNTTVAFPVGTTLKFRQCSTGTVILDGEGAVVLNPITDYLTESAQEGAVIEAIKISTNEWDVFGLLAPAST